MNPVPQLRGPPGLVIMREIRRCHQQGAAVIGHHSQGVAQCPPLLLISHDDGHKLEVAQDDLFHQNRMRVINRHELNSKLKGEISKWTREALLAELDKSHIPAGAINNMQDLFDIPLAKAMVLDNEGVPGLKQVAFKVE